MTKAEEESQKSSEFKKKYELTKSICLELEDQVKEYEVVIEKLEKMQQTLKESNEDLKTKADSSGSELIKVQRSILLNFAFNTYMVKSDYRKFSSKNMLDF